jgi:hypothetical protein
MIWLRAIEAALPGKPDSSKLVQATSCKAPIPAAQIAFKYLLDFIPSKF